MTKKILPPSKSGAGCAGVRNYTYPVFHSKGKSFYVDFFAYDPARDVMRRKKFMLNNIRNKRERQKEANALITVLADKLRSGWNPFAETDSYRGYTLIEDALDMYLDHIAKMGRRKTVHSYTSRVNVFREFLKIAQPVKYVYQIDHRLAVDFLDYLYIDRDVQPRTYNNYRGWLGSLGEWLVERRYMDANPVAGIPKKKENEKKRKALSHDMLKRLYAFLEETDRHFLLAVMMEYYMFIRPSELVGLRLSYFRIKEQKVLVPGAISKNCRDGYVGVPEEVLRLMVDLGVFSNPGDFFLFSKDMRPGERQMGPDIFNKRWTQCRKRLQWGDEYQFYSLKDSGIRDLANEKGIVIARDQARHSDISTTNRYLGPEAGVREETKTFVGALSAM